MMNNFSLLLPNRDEKDIGFRSSAHMSEQHYYRSKGHSSLAISHCMLVTPKQALLEDSTKKYCHHCEVIEQMRDERI